MLPQSVRETGPDILLAVTPKFQREGAMDGLGPLRGMRCAPAEGLACPTGRIPAPISRILVNLSRSKLRICQAQFRV